MKSLVFIFFTFSTTVFAATDSDQSFISKKISDVVTSLNKNECKHNYYSPSFLADEMSRKIANNEANADIFIEALKSSCDYDIAKQISSDLVKGDKLLKSFKKISERVLELDKNECKNNYYSPNYLGNEMSKKVVNNEADEDNFLEALKSSCDYGIAKQISTDLVKGDKLLKSFKKISERVLELDKNECKNNYYSPNFLGSEISQMVLNKELDADVFLEALKSSCNYDTAKAMASYAKAQKELSQTDVNINLTNDDSDRNHTKIVFKDNISKKDSKNTAISK